MKLLILIILSISSLLAQPTGFGGGQVVYRTNLSVGACQNGTIEVKISDGTQNVCKGGNWGAPPGGAASAGGTNGQIQINSSGSLGGIAAGGDLTFSQPNFTVVGLNGTALSGLATGILKNTTATGVPSIAVAGDFPTLNQSTTGNAATSTALAAAPAKCATGQFPLGINASGTAQNCQRLPQVWFGSGAPGSVTGNLGGDVYIDTTNNATYFCNNNAATPACTSVAAGQWTGAVGTTAGLTSGLPIIGNGGSVIALGARTGSTSTYVSSNGASTSNAALKFDASGNGIASGVTIDGSNNVTTAGTMTSGSGSGNSGYYQFNGATSGSTGWTTPNVSGTQSFFVLPNPNGATFTNTFLQITGTTTCPTGVPGANCYATAIAVPPGTGTVNSGTIHQLGVYAATGAAISGDANVTENAGLVTVGVAGSVQGEVDLAGSTSGQTKLIAPASGGGSLTLPAGTFNVVGDSATQTLTNKSIAGSEINSGTVPAAQIPAVLTTVGTSRTIANNAEIIICTGACTVTPPATGSTVAGMQFCAQNDDNIATIITIAAVTSVQYETQARTAYKAAATAIASGGAIKDQVCFVARDATHWNMFSSTGSWN